MVFERGDEAVLELTAPLRRDRDAPGLAAGAGVRGAQALERLEPSLRESMEVAAANIRSVAEAQIDSDAAGREPSPGPDRHDPRDPRRGGRGLRAGRPRRLPVQRPDVRDPGPCRGRRAGRARDAAGPRRQGQPVVLAAAGLCEVDEVYAMGGAQAIFALALGTETIDRVSVIAGPGNAWVREAKRRVVGLVGNRLARRPLGADGGHRPRHRPGVGRPRPLRPG